jgi:alkylation response protein AidB-like acyl-CoA dehydrogenase
VFFGVAKWDEASEFPVETFKKTAELGFAGLFVKDDVGGSGLSRCVCCCS